MSKRKLAICFSGQPRMVRDTYERFLKFNLLECNITEFDIDIFVHTWFSMDDVGKVYQTPVNRPASEPIPATVISDIIELYQPKSILVEPQRYFDEKNFNERKYPENKVFTSLSRMYSTFKANELAKQYWHTENVEIQYDIKLAIRFDLVLHAPLSVSQFDISQNTLYHPSGCPHPDSVNVALCLGNPYVMNVYSETPNFIHKYFNETPIPFGDEVLTGHHLNVHGIGKETFDIPYNFNRNT